ncbi:PREDICTED: pachytene checkpoint protein 2 homolog [Drosophila arizonae]|uniref:Pachytene checkpoint protein 2 homolog n=1 Tax=Drosophila arizonae TaxID=7263 RepID=A0ABM1Q4J4_DROAR|nr:PREDICTED: pachytene checkpoint protein 2 homolog [Drosophila arizonae]
MNFLSNSNTVHVEVRLHRCEQRMQTLQAEIEPQLDAYLKSLKTLRWNLAFDASTHIPAIQSILLEKDNGENGIVKLDNRLKFRYHYYMTQRPELRSGGGFFDGEGDVNADDLDSVISANHVLLPASEFVGLWDNLIYEEGLKEKLLKFALSALSFSQHNVDSNVIACNRLLLLHGPPGTGKTSLCKALAQKLAVRTQKMYAYTHLVEINSHSLFSKWFSESGKLVARLFGKIGELVADKNNLVCVLIDEVESLAYQRSAMSSNEPRDAMRVVNAVLTQLDDIKACSNVLILATSNLAHSIDLAFLDRADIRQYIGLPAISAIVSIYKSMLTELMVRGIVQTEPLEKGQEDSEDLISSLAERSVGLSGRTLRKLPLLAHAQHTSRDLFEVDQKITLSDFLDAMLLSLEQLLAEKRHLKLETYTQEMA